MERTDASRRRFVKKAAYVAPAILSLNAVSAVAKTGSEKKPKPKPKPKPKRGPAGGGGDDRG